MLVAGALIMGRYTTTNFKNEKSRKSPGKLFLIKDMNPDYCHALSLVDARGQFKAKRATQYHFFHVNYFFLEMAK